MLTAKPSKNGITTITYHEARSIIGPARGFIAAYDGVINLTNGCGFGCDYCYAANFTSSDAEQDNWGRWTNVKQNAAERLHDLPAGELNGRTLYMSTATDPYQPVERKLELTRHFLAVMAERHPRVKLVIQTRGTLVTRDTDVLRSIIDAGGRVQVNMTVTTDNDATRIIYERGCASIPKRLEAIKAVQDAGIQSCITITPCLPVADPASFARSLLSTGVQRFIIQPFQLNNSGRGKMIADTDQKALEKTAQFFNCPLAQAPKVYLEQYRITEAALKQSLPNLGVGRAGFAPPF